MTTALPLLRDVNRCLAHGFRPGETCQKADLCARHVTIRHDLAPVATAYRCCPTEQFQSFIPLPATVTPSAPAICLHPMGSLGEEVESEGGEL